VTVPIGNRIKTAAVEHIAMSFIVGSIVRSMRLRFATNADNPLFPTLDIVSFKSRLAKQQPPIDNRQPVRRYGGAMERSFIVVTAIASTLMFAGVWKATEPRPTAAPAIVAIEPRPDTAVAAPPVLPRHTVAPARRAADAKPYNVVRTAYGSSPPARRSTGTGSESSVSYSGCREARAAGAAPLHRGQPGYRAGMDGDGDGIACENYR
jgi:hypothetical protein